MKLTRQKSIIFILVSLSLYITINWGLDYEDEYDGDYDESMKYQYLIDDDDFDEEFNEGDNYVDDDGYLRE